MTVFHGLKERMWSYDQRAGYIFIILKRWIRTTVIDALLILKNADLDNTLSYSSTKRIHILALQYITQYKQCIVSTLSVKCIEHKIEFIYTALVYVL